MPVDTLIKVRRDVKENWESVDPVLGSGEFSLETDTGLIKCGDGYYHYKDLKGVNLLETLRDVLLDDLQVNDTIMWNGTKWTNTAIPQGQDGERGATGEPGYTPIKGVDYFDGLPGATGPTGPAGQNGTNGSDGGVVYMYHEVSDSSVQAATTDVTLLTYAATRDIAVAGWIDLSNLQATDTVVITVKLDNKVHTALQYAGVQAHPMVFVKDRPIGNGHTYSIYVRQTTNPSNLRTILYRFYEVG
jgi:hypothetical protein